MYLYQRTVSCFLILSKVFLVVGINVNIAYGAALENANAAMLGRWQNLNNGDLMGLHLLGGGECEIYVERALQPRSNRGCKYESFQDGFLIFLKNAEGICGSEADFEFIFEPDAPLIRLQLGAGDVILQKVHMTEN